MSWHVVARPQYVRGALVTRRTSFAGVLHSLLTQWACRWSPNASECNPINYKVWSEINHPFSNRSNVTSQIAKFHGPHEWPTCVPLMGHTWAATNGSHWSMPQFSTWGPCVFPLKGPTWDPRETHVCLPSVLPMLGQYVITITIMGPHMGCHVCLPSALPMCDCPACRTYEIATRFWVVVICPIIKCLIVLEFSLF